MNIAALRVAVTFQKNTAATDGYGNHTNTWEDYFVCHATVGTDASGSETGDAVTVGEETLTFTCRYCTELAAVVSTKYRILAEGRIYNITHVNPMGYKRNTLKFTCSPEARP